MCTQRMIHNLINCHVFFMKIWKFGIFTTNMNFSSSMHFVTAFQQQQFLSKVKLILKFFITSTAFKKPFTKNSHQTKVVLVISLRKMKKANILNK